MEIADLQDSPWRCMGPVLGRDMLRRELRLVAVGWLGKSHASPGSVPDECIDRLFEAYASGLVIGDPTRGAHTCELCFPENPKTIDGAAVMIADEPVVEWRGKTLRLYGHGQHVVRFKDVLYSCPALILHYILGHGYRPPAEFLDAVRQGAFLSRRDLNPLCETRPICEATRGIDTRDQKTNHADGPGTG
jgi:hypothetical protein